VTDRATVRRISGLVIMVNPNCRNTGIVSGYASATSATCDVSVTGAAAGEPEQYQFLSGQIAQVED
jgi:hypothetical protein